MGQVLRSSRGHWPAGFATCIVNIFHYVLVLQNGVVYFKNKANLFCKLYEWESKYLIDVKTHLCFVIALAWSFIVVAVRMCPVAVVAQVSLLSLTLATSFNLRPEQQGFEKGDENISHVLL